ncbi:hypothetical protein GCM10022224_080690 [Nonomuraea antimicrobica]|uniref:Uncharacterized protein n=2 Tax=Nonomuraea antimicrobica TaxID=561173 RepID=A0ABP7D9N5_9ACTN
MVTNKIPRPMLGKSAINAPRRFGSGQLFIGLFCVFLALSNMAMGWSRTLSLALNLLAVGCTLIGSYFMLSALFPRRTP